MAYRFANKFGRGSGAITTLGTKTFDGATAVDPTTDRITVTTHGYATGDSVRLTGTTPPVGLVAGNVYFVNVVDANTIRLSKRWDLAASGIYIDITADGSGTITLTQVEAVEFPRPSRNVSVIVLGTNMTVKYCYDLDAPVQLWKEWTAGAVSALTDATFNGVFQVFAIEGANGNYSYNWD